jgi:hypothetical protein
MTQADLIEALQTIHDELESGEDLDPVEVNKLRETVREIEATWRTCERVGFAL